MKLVLAIIHDEDAGRLTTALNKEGFQVTKLASTGGFLRVGNTTMLIGVEEDRLDEALKIVGFDTNWLIKTLKGQNVKPEDVFIMTTDRAQNFQIVKKEEKE